MKTTKIEEDCEINKSTFWIGTIFVFIFLTLITVVAYNQRQMFINSHKESLQILASEKASQINTFLEAEKDKLLLISSISEFKNAASYPNDPTKREIAKKRINELKDIIPGISILNSKGI